jgi:dihydroflavonol-4-reductase
MRVLITGGTGFLGSHLCRRMLADGHDVRLLVRSRSHRQDDVSTVLGDVTAPETLEAAIKDREWVVHAAADLNYWRENPERQMKVNVEGTRNIARACREGGVQRMLHVSSVAAVGIPASSQPPASESFPFNLENSGLVYHLSKRRAEESVLAEVERGLNAVIVNPASVTGPGRLSGLIRNVRRGPVVPCFSGGNCVVHVADVVDGIRAAIACGKTGQRYILGGENLTFRAMAERAARAMNLSRRFVAIPPFVTGCAAAVFEPWGRWRHRPPKFAHMIHYCANRFLYYDSSKARHELQYCPRDFDGILQDALQ